jgi:hypothetical protein
MDEASMTRLSILEKVDQAKAVFALSEWSKPRVIEWALDFMLANELDVASIINEGDDE